MATATAFTADETSAGSRLRVSEMGNVIGLARLATRNLHVFVEIYHRASSEATPGDQPQAAADDSQQSYWSDQ
jgi:hypothetical protein